MLLGTRGPDEEVQSGWQGQDGRENLQELAGIRLPAGASDGNKTNHDLIKSHGIQ